VRKPIILFGGASYEHEISIVSAISLYRTLSCQSLFVFLSPNHHFYLINLIDMRAEHFASGKYRKDTKLFLTRGGFEKRGFLFRTQIDGDLVINIVHGADGEDGKIAALLDFYEIPYVGPRVEASVLSFNKLFTKFLAKSAGVKTLPFEKIMRGGAIKTPYPFIIKPLRLGSSIGIEVVKSEADLEYARDVAFEFDSEAIVEPFIANVSEYNLAGALANGEWLFSVIEEPLKKEMLDFDQKYLDFARSGKAKEADINGDLAEKIREEFKKIYGEGFEGALIRCDFFVIGGEVYLNEINPVPGSLANYLFDDYESVLNSLIEHLPKSKRIDVTYRYIHSIRSQKGKL
jgi:D-alanine-D-alanine ligase